MLKKFVFLIAFIGSQLSIAVEGTSPPPSLPEPQSQHSQFYAAANGFFSYTSTTAATGASAPTLFTEGFGFVVSYKITPVWMLGLSTDYNFINQPNDPGSGGINFSGNRWNIISPSLGFRAGPHLFLLDYEFLGNWSLAKPAANSGSVQYQSPSGIRMRYEHTLPFIEDFLIGVQLEYINFTQINNSVSGTSSLSTTQNLTSIGALLSYPL